MGPSEGFETLAYGLLYFFCSASMLLFNKLAINDYPAPGLLILYQYVFCVVAVIILKICKVVEVDPLEWKTIKKYWPVPALFACAVFSNNKILQYANIETFIVVRNTTPLFVSTIEFFLMGKNLPSLRSFFCFTLIIFGAIMYGATDKGFQLESYIWASIYLVIFCSEMVFVKHIFNSVKMTTWGRMLYTNLLSIPFQPMFIFMTKEFEGYNELILTSNGLIYIVLSCVGGFAISFAGIGFRSKVSATTFTVIGVVNKIVTIIINFMMWDKHANSIGLFSLCLCLIGSTLYAPADFRELNSGSVSEKIWKSCNQITCGCCENYQLARDNQKRPPSPKKDDNEGGDLEEQEFLLSKKTMKVDPSQASKQM